MASLVIKNLPDELHRRLKDQASRHHRIMAKEAIAILSEELSSVRVEETPAPYKGKFQLTEDFLDRAMREGRE